MMFLLANCGRAARTLAISFTFVAALLSVATSAHAIEFSLGPEEVIYNAKQRKKLNLGMWPDGNLGIVRVADDWYDFYGANGGKPVKTSGSLWSPGKSKKSVAISGVPKKAFDYLAGGPVYQDPTTGARLMIYHAEQHGKKTSKKYYSMLGMAVSTDPSGRKFRDLGIIIQPDLPDGRAEIGGGTFAVLDGYLHIYFKDVSESGAYSELSVARAPLAEVVSNALDGQRTLFTKYYNGGWTEPGLSGRSSPLEITNPSNYWNSVSYNEYLDQLVMVSSQWTPSQPDLYITTSSDGVNWSPRQALVTDGGEQFYPSIIGTGDDPTVTGQSFFLYYTDSKKGAWNRWKDAQLVRREVMLEPWAVPAGLAALSTGDLYSPAATESVLMLGSPLVVPEPASVHLLLGVGAFACGLRRRRSVCFHASATDCALRRS